MSNIPDLNGRELAALIPLVVVIVWIGVYPQFFLRRMEPSIRNVVAVVESKRPNNEQLARQAAPADHTDTPVIAKD
jgi:NADH:ubiquinone oxidoreductase subunit 4 (subunit M)